LHEGDALQATDVRPVFSELKVASTGGVAYCAGLSDNQLSRFWGEASSRQRSCGKGCVHNVCGLLAPMG